MKQLFLTIIISISFISKVYPNNNTNSSQKYPIPGSHLLIEHSRKIQQFNTKYLNKIKHKRSTNYQWNFTVGDTHNWWATNLINYNEYEVPSTCRAIGDHCYIFVENAIWGNRIDESSVNKILNAFEYSTPSSASKGIYDTGIENFGDPPDVDNDPRIIILILDIQDGFSGSGGYVAGYFYSANQYPDGDPALGGTRSNFTEIYYLDANPADLSSDQGSNDVLATTAHEFQHMIHWNWDEFEATFVNEGCSMIAEHICGYDLDYWFNLYQNDTNRSLFYWDDNDPFPDYARAALWTLYLYEQLRNEGKYVKSTGISLCLRLLGNAYLQKGEYEKAIGYLNNALKESSINDAGDVKTYHLLGQAYAKRLQAQEAVFYFSKVLQLSQNFYNVPWMNKTVAEARRFLQKANFLLEAQRKRQILLNQKNN